ncbi:hypothetical protein KDL45_12925, partial [bacterium]|nr:hypothetical protein [bacterium]
MSTQFTVPLIALIVVVTAILIVGSPACGGGGSGNTRQTDENNGLPAETDDDTTDDDNDDTPFAENNFVIEECEDAGTGHEECAWRYRVNADRCTGAQCSKLVIYFAGGDMKCLPLEPLLQTFS